MSYSAKDRQWAKVVDEMIMGEKKKAVELIDAMDWRIRLLHYTLRYLDTEEGAAQQARIRSDLEMLTLEIRGILEDPPGLVQTAAINGG